MSLVNISYNAAAIAGYEIAKPSTGGNYQRSLNCMLFLLNFQLALLNSGK